MSETKFLDGWMTTRERRPIVLVLSVVAGCLTGMVAIILLRASPVASAPNTKADFLWWAIPLVGLCWAFIRWTWRSAVAWSMGLAVGTCFVGSWIVSKSEPFWIGDIIQQAGNDLDVLAFAALLIGIMALIDFLVLAPFTAKLFVVCWIVSFPVISILSHYTSGFTGTKLYTTLVALWAVSSIAGLWTVLVETALLLVWETRAGGANL